MTPSSHQSFKLALFAYNFPHKKTQDFIFRLVAEGYRIDGILAADPVKLNIPPASIRSKLRHTGLLHPQVVAERLNIPYTVLPHRGPEVEAYLAEQRFDLGIVAGARILKQPVIDQFSVGIMNYHPGIIPQARGLDAMLWSIREDIPLGVTAHLIDAHVDAGKILIQHEIPLYADDHYLDLSERLYDTQLDLLRPAIEKAMAGDIIEEINPSDSVHHRKMDPELEHDTFFNCLPQYLKRRVPQPVAAAV